MIACASSSSSTCQHSEHRDGDRPAEIQRLGGPGEDGVGIAQVGVDIVRCPFRAAGQQPPCVREHQRVVVDVDDPGPRNQPLGDLMGIVRRRQPGPDIQELAPARLASQIAHGPAQELAVLPRLLPDVRQQFGDAVAYFAVDLVIVLAAEPVIPDPGRVGSGRVVKIYSYPPRPYPAGVHFPGQQGVAVSRAACGRAGRRTAGGTRRRSDPGGPSPIGGRWRRRCPRPRGRRLAGPGGRARA